MRPVNITDTAATLEFPFLFGGTFIEAIIDSANSDSSGEFPFLFGGTFIEANVETEESFSITGNFPSFSEGLSLRHGAGTAAWCSRCISLPFRRDFH